MHTYHTKLRALHLTAMHVLNSTIWLMRFASSLASILAAAALSLMRSSATLLARSSGLGPSLRRLSSSSCDIFHVNGWRYCLHTLALAKSAVVSLAVVAH